MAVLALTSACTTDAGPAPTPTRPAAAASAASFDSATRGDAEFNRRFRHEFADVDGVRMHDLTLAAIRAQTRPRMSNITRAVEVPKAGHWLPEENPAFVTAQLLAFFADRPAR